MFNYKVYTFSRYKYVSINSVNDICLIYYVCFVGRLCYRAYCHAYWGCRKADCLGCLNKLKGQNVRNHIGFIFTTRDQNICVLWVGLSLTQITNSRN